MISATDPAAVLLGDLCVHRSAMDDLYVHRSAMDELRHIIEKEPLVNRFVSVPIWDFNHALEFAISSDVRSQDSPFVICAVGIIDAALDVCNFPAKGYMRTALPPPPGRGRPHRGAHLGQPQAAALPRHPHLPRHRQRRRRGLPGRQ